MLYGARTPGGIIGQYTEFARTVSEQYKIYGGKNRLAVIKAIEMCIERNILKDYLETLGGEVMNLKMQEYQQEIATEMYGNWMLSSILYKGGGR